MPYPPIEALLPQFLAHDPGLFVLDVEFHKGGKSRLVITLDHDQGLTTDSCASVSRQLGKYLEEHEDLTEGAFILEVTSPGADQPLRVPRQFPKHIGRTLRVKMLEGNEFVGELALVEEDGIVILAEVRDPKKKLPKHKPVPTEERKIAFNEIAEAQVELRFK